jgi:hypothetical protein
MHSSRCLDDLATFGGTGRGVDGTQNTVMAALDYDAAPPCDTRMPVAYKINKISGIMLK